MTLIDFVLILVVAAAAGGIGRALAGYYPGGVLTSILIGFIGAVVGTWLSRVLMLPGWLAVIIGGTVFPFLWAVIGSTLFLVILGLLTGTRKV